MALRLALALQDYVEVTCEPEPMHGVDAYGTNNIESRSREGSKQRQPLHAPSVKSGKVGYQGVSPTGRRRLVRMAEPTFQHNPVLPTPPPVEMTADDSGHRSTLRGRGPRHACNYRRASA